MCRIYKVKIVCVVCFDDTTVTVVLLAKWREKKLFYKFVIEQLKGKENTYFPDMNIFYAVKCDAMAKQIDNNNNSKKKQKKHENEKRQPNQISVWIFNAVYKRFWSFYILVLYTIIILHIFNEFEVERMRFHYITIKFESQNNEFRPFFCSCH